MDITWIAFLGKITHFLTVISFCRSSLPTRLMPQSNTCMFPKKTAFWHKLLLGKCGQCILAPLCYLIAVSTAACWHFTLKKNWICLLIGANSIVTRHDQFSKPKTQDSLAIFQAGISPKCDTRVNGSNLVQFAAFHYCMAWSAYLSLE